ncbi:MAG TPA: ATP-binding protein [Ktedonobacteraceae bacterium]|nr:ATP-binding protein [Ktedonobacteraceae bacterium]
MGLPITRRLVEDHKGHLLVESQPGHGATFSVRLPIIENSGEGGVGKRMEDRP